MLPPHLPSDPHAPSSTMGKEDLATQPWQPSAPPDRWDLLPCISIYSTFSIYSPGCARFSMYPDLPPPTYAESVWGVANVRRQVIFDNIGDIWWHRWSGFEILCHRRTMRILLEILSLSHIIQHTTPIIEDLHFMFVLPAWSGQNVNWYWKTKKWNKQIKRGSNRKTSQEMRTLSHI